MAGKVEASFTKADSSNLPRVTAEMITNYFIENKQFVSVVSRGQKHLRSSRQSYGDSAIGYVQIKRDGNTCVVKGKITPEDKVHAKAYSVSAIIAENCNKIDECVCQDCAAAKGGCKHLIAFLFWLHQRIEEPSTTDVLCYWKKSELSKVGSSKKFMKLSEMVSIKKMSTTNSHIVLEKFCEVSEGKNIDSLVLNLKRGPCYSNLSLHQLFISFQRENIKDITAKTFLEYCSQKMNKSDCIDAAETTKDQSKNSKWHELRFGRITASKIFEASRCTTDGSLVKNTFGATHFFPTEAMQRGLRLEDEVVKCVEKLCKIKTRKCGLVLDQLLPAFGASPDAISDEYIIEVKCPKTSLSNFIKKDMIVERYQAQMQLQMKMCKKNKGIFAVADPQFEDNKKVYIKYIQYDECMCSELIKDSLKFWVTHIYTKFSKILIINDEIQ